MSGGNSSSSPSFSSSSSHRLCFEDEDDDENEEEATPSLDFNHTPGNLPANSVLSRPEIPARLRATQI
jgi:hypothetical protein